MIAPETEAMFVERFLQREATSKQTMAVKAEEKAKGHDWVVPCDTVGCTEIIAVCREIEELRRERDAWKNVCSLAGICMSCALGSPEPFGCPDCLNTGWSEGAPQDEHEAKSALVEAVKLIQSLVHMAGVKPSNELMAAASAFAAKHGGRDG